MKVIQSHVIAPAEKAPGLVRAIKTVNQDGANVVEIFSRLKDVIGGTAYFFQTCVDRGALPSKTYMGFDSFERICVKAGVTYVYRDGEVRPISGNPFEVIALHLKQYQTKNNDDSFFSCGGAMGHFGFESVRYIEPKLKGHPGSFEMLDREGQAADAEFHLFKKILIFDHAEATVRIIVCRPFIEGHSSNGQPALQPVAAAGANADIETVEKLLSSVTENSTLVAKGESSSTEKDLELTIGDLKCAMGREKYVEAVLSLQKNIAAGDIFQAVLSDHFERRCEVKPFELFRVLVERSPSAYQFYFEADKKTFFGASPEMLLSVKGRILETHPIAGTRPRGRDLTEEIKFEQELLTSEKENAEHLMLVDLSRNDIGRISVPGQVTVGATHEIKKFPGVMHLVTRVLGQLAEGNTALHALAACFPAGTLSGAPKIRAMQLLSELERLPRKFYGGAVGLISFEDDLEMCIAIRCAEVAHGVITFRAGAGIVADSEPHFEYDEILHKTRSLRQAIAVAENRLTAR